MGNVLVKVGILVRSVTGQVAAVHFLPHVFQGRQRVIL